MNKEQLTTLFDQQATNYDKQWKRMAPINDGLYFLLEYVFSELPQNARILCVGAGTGKEIVYLANKFPKWHFTAVEPSQAMLDVCRQKAEVEKIVSRCHFHQGYLDSLATDNKYDAATCFLVSQFILNRQSRTEFFRQIADRLKQSGVLANADLSFDTDSKEYQAILEVWQRTMSGANLTQEELNRILAAYEKDVAILPSKSVAEIIEAAGFETPIQFFQAGLIHAWFAKRG